MSHSIQIKSYPEFIPGPELFKALHLVYCGWAGRAKEMHLTMITTKDSNIATKPPKRAVSIEWSVATLFICPAAAVKARRDNYKNSTSGALIVLIIPASPKPPTPLTCMPSSERERQIRQCNILLVVLSRVETWLLDCSS